MLHSHFKRRPANNGFRGHPHYQKAHQRILTHPLKEEAKYFKTRDFKPSDFFWNLKAASCRQSSISATADILRDGGGLCPSKEEMLKCLRAIPEIEVEDMANRVLLKQYEALPAPMRQELEQSGRVIFDFHKEPYWGDPAKAAAIAGQKEHDACYHLVYLTADLTSDHFRFTIYITSRVEGFSIVTYLPGALTQVKRVVEPRLLLFDGEFSVVETLEYLDQLLIPWNARKSMTKAVKEALRGYFLDPSQMQHRHWHLAEIKNDKLGKSVHLHATVQGRGKKLKAIIKPVWYSQPPEKAEANYDTRFGIDSGYKEKHSFLARTSSRSWAVRLVLFLISALLWNVWRLALAWAYLQGTPPLLPEERRYLSRNMITFYLAMYLLHDGWKL